MQIDISGGYNIIVSLRGYGTNAVDWKVTPARKRGGIVTQGGQEITFTTTGSNNRNGGSFVFYGEFEVGDKIWLELTRIAGNGNFTAISGNWNFQQLYRD